MVAVAAAVAALGTVSGTMSALGAGHGANSAASASRSPGVSRSTEAAPGPPAPTARSTRAPKVPKSPATSAPSTRTGGPPTSAPAAGTRAAAPDRLYRPAGSRVADWVAAHPEDPRTAVIAARVADRPAAVWFTDPTVSAVTARVAAVTSAARARGRVPVVVPYAIPGRDCGGASQGGAPDIAAYDRWIDAFAAGLGTGEVIVILEPDSIAQSGCLPSGARAERFAALARAGRVLKSADPRARVYYDAGHSGWNPPARQAAWLRQAGATAGDGVFSNVANFRTTSDEIAYDRDVLADLGGSAGLGAVVDTSRNGNGPPADGAWCDPPGRRLGAAPTLDTGVAGVDAYLWVKLPGESDGCRGAAGTFSPSYAYELALGSPSS
ncbi:glycoside hydrolase family 6 protein [Streptomyces mangrovisoli]|uniref:Glucanase n=1 Tax=Streptomyces mangrovisoli TaxID=1428628 RepID=A0A1J4NT10_9ACTN|nr:glycoside hydrolase family 6 protein [Streptomyces mangrovisoli]OIJ65625.1 endoglucanase [Streptomyces mangrovisoli]